MEVSFYFAGHPDGSYLAERAFALYRLIAKALMNGDDEKVAEYRDELQHIRDCTQCADFS